MYGVGAVRARLSFFDGRLCLVALPSLLIHCTFAVQRGASVGTAQHSAAQRSDWMVVVWRLCSAAAARWRYSTDTHHGDNTVTVRCLHRDTTFEGHRYHGTWNTMALAQSTRRFAAHELHAQTHARTHAHIGRRIGWQDEKCMATTKTRDGINFMVDTHTDHI